MRSDVLQLLILLSKFCHSPRVMLSQGCTKIQAMAPLAARPIFYDDSHSDLPRWLSEAGVKDSADFDMGIIPAIKVLGWGGSWEPELPVCGGRDHKFGGLHYILSTSSHIMS
jgi:hypothetical protein